MFDKWICKFVNYFEDRNYKTVTFGDFVSALMGLFIVVLSCGLVIFLFSMVFGLMYGIVMGLEDEIKLLFIGFFITCIFGFIMWICGIFWNTEIAQCPKR